jgi:hypothetical protein
MRECRLLPCRCFVTQLTRSENPERYWISRVRTAGYLLPVLLEELFYETDSRV